MTETFEPGEIFIYRKAPGVYELGVVKCQRDERTYYCYYSAGDTAAATPSPLMHKLVNAKWSPIRWVNLWGGNLSMVGDVLKLIPGSQEVTITNGSNEGIYCRAVGVPESFMGLQVVGITATEGCIDIEVLDV